MHSKGDPEHMNTYQKHERMQLPGGTGGDENRNENLECGIKKIFDALSAWTSNFSLVS